MMWEWFNDFYICEAYFYSEYRAACPVPTCEFYWGEVECESASAKRDALSLSAQG